MVCIILHGKSDKKYTCGGGCPMGAVKADFDNLSPKTATVAEKCDFAVFGDSRRLRWQCGQAFRLQWMGTTCDKTDHSKSRVMRVEMKWLLGLNWSRIATHVAFFVVLLVGATYSKQRIKPYFHYGCALRCVAREIETRLCISRHATQRAVAMEISLKASSFQIVSGWNLARLFFT